MHSYRLSLVFTACLSLSCQQSEFKAASGDTEAASQDIDQKRETDQKSETKISAAWGLSQEFVPNFSRAIDILLVVDNSGSMQDEQVQLSTQLLPLLSEIQNEDWRLAITTTDPQGQDLTLGTADDRCVHEVIIKGEADIENRFSNAVKVGTAGSGIELPILKAEQGLKAGCGRNWMRAKSNVAIVIVSDEDNCYHDQANGYRCSAYSYGENKYLLDTFKALDRTPGMHAKVYGLISHPSAPCSQADAVGTKLAQLIEATKGVWGSICASSYQDTLGKISKNLAAFISGKIVLDAKPLSESLKVTNEKGKNVEYTIDGTNLSIAEGQEADHIKVQYVPEQHLQASHLNIPKNADRSLKVLNDALECGKDDALLSSADGVLKTNKCSINPAASTIKLEML